MYQSALVGLLLAVWLVAAMVPVWAQSQVMRPKRLVHLFDFEEPENFESLPMNWFIIGRTAETDSSTFFREPLHHDLMEQPGYPSYTQVRFDDTCAVSGRRSFYLGLNGGNAGAFLQVGAIPAIPQSDYLITAAVRTEGLQRAGAHLVAYFIDRDGNRVAESLVETRPIRTSGQWSRVMLKLRGEVKGAVWIGLQVELRQPSQPSGDPLGKQRIRVQDLHGQAWFDDIAIWQLPRVQVATQNRVNLIRAPERPRLDISVRDLTSHVLNVETTVYDHHLIPVAVERRRLGPGQPRYWSWEPDLPKYGWFLVDMQVRDEDESGSGIVANVSKAERTSTPVARTFGTFVWFAPGGTIHALDADRFQIHATGLPAEHLQFVDDLLDITGLRSVVISVWDFDTSPQTIETRKDLLQQLMRWLYLTGRTTSFSLDPVPSMLATESVGVADTDPIAILSQPDEMWISYLTPTLLHHGQYVSQWYLGSTRQAYAFFDPDLPKKLDRIQSRFNKLTPSPKLVIPWRIDQSRRQDLPDTVHYLVDVPPAVAAGHLSDHLQQWSDAMDRVQLSLREPPADKVAHPRRVTDLALRMIEAWEHQPGTLAVSNLWTRAAQRDEAWVPDPLLGVFANVAQQLAGRRVLDRLEPGGDVQIRILNGPAGPALAAWARYPGLPQSDLNLYLGEQPVVIDVWGNRTTLSLVNGKHHYSLSDTPVFITGIDEKLALFRAGFKIDRPFIESTQTLHERVLTLTNPWPVAISGYLRLVGPEGWTSTPTRHFFSIPSGHTVKIPVSLRFPVSEVAGSKQLTVNVDMTVDQPMRIELSLPIEVGLEDVQMDSHVALAPGTEGNGKDLVASAVVTNTGNHPLSLYVFANLPGYSIQERIIADLGPGQSAVRRFRFPIAGRDVRGQSIRMGVREVDGPRMLNKRLTIGDTE
ncbi:MAG: hypothetical protein Kow00105_07210 [Phycisphaeraceae bacterium]